MTELPKPGVLCLGAVNTLSVLPPGQDSQCSSQPASQQSHTYSSSTSCGL